MENSVIQLGSALMLTKGGQRTYYRHPDNEQRCIKIPHGPKNRIANWVEVETNRIYDRRKIPLTHRAACYGWVATNMGEGIVVERVMNADGSPALTLYDAVSQRQIKLKQAIALLDELSQCTIKHAVVVADLKIFNMLVRFNDDQQPQLVFVDGVGAGRNKLKIFFYQIPFFARLKTKKKWWRKRDYLRTMLQQAMQERRKNRRP